MDLITRINRTRFLGREFLTWLWHESELKEGRISEEGDGVEVWFDGRLVLEASGDIKEQSVIKSESPTETGEAREALRSGKLPVDARLRVISGQKQWTTNIKAQELQLHGTKLPALLTEGDEEGLYERFYLMEELENIIEHLYAQFIAMRLDDDAWRDKVTELRAWVQAGGIVSEEA